MSCTNFLRVFYTRGVVAWVDGLLLDFVQKKTTDTWVRRYVVYTGFLLSEGFVFEAVVGLYLDLLVRPLHDTSTSEPLNVSSMVGTTLFLYLTLFLLTFIVLALLG